MEIIDGLPLDRWVDERRSSLAERARLVMQLAAGLGYAHEHNVVHRDIKPDNVLVTKSGRVKIMDFGIARLDEPGVTTATGLLLGSPRYMAPEQVAGRAFDHRADVFSLGVVLYEMLTGTAPFGGEDIPQLMFQVMNAAVPPPSRANPSLPSVLDYIVARALKKNPDERYANADEFAKDLRESLHEVAKSEAAARHRSEAAAGGTVPLAAQPVPAKTDPRHAPVFQGDDDLVALRPSPRFDAVEGLARLAVLPLDATRSLAVTAAGKPRWRVDLQFVVVVAGYVLATLVAAYIMLS
jgi:serine/threonine-protein kinase